MYSFIVEVYLKKGVSDPEGANVMKTLNLMGYEVKSVKTIKTYEITIDANSKKDAEQKIKDICEKLLANPVIQNYKYHLIEK